MDAVPQDDLTVSELDASDTPRIAPSNRAASHRPGRPPQGLLQRVTAAIEREFDGPGESIALLPERHRTFTVRRLLAGELVEPAELAELRYDVQLSWHLGAIATGSAGRDALQRAATRLGCQVLEIPADDGTTWVWFGASKQLNVLDAEQLLSGHPGMSSPLAIGGPRLGLRGWRQTHREAAQALQRALQGPESVVRYGDKPLLAGALGDETLAAWLRGFVAPIRNRPDGGVGLLKTLRAYIDTECNSSSAASKLGVRRQTVASRLRIAEKLLNRPLRTCLAEIDVALQIIEITDPPAGVPAQEWWPLNS
jgi:hypothetical protein